ncbi:hypothetical protein AAFC00_002869 [Neodothiora populina]|uniref:Purine nucleoside phosphorylase n=1 Tax=Neodothiora populina TaxID=2781224 RepID=A0ABR3P8H3_9PEZI
MAAVTEQEQQSGHNPGSPVFKQATESAAFIRSKLPRVLHTPRVAIVCGSGLGGIASTINQDVSVEIAYSGIPNFPKTTVQGHAGKLVAAFMGDSKVPVLLLVGRAHFYEGHAMEMVSFATRVCKVMGVETMLMTNAAGGLNPDYRVGDIVVLNDHLNLAGLVGFHPLRGPNAEDFGVRFPPLSDAYDLGLRQKAYQVWQQIKPSGSGRRVHEGVYAFVAGPTYETRAECRLLHTLGADVVGMSTVPEIVVARHCGMKILAFSLVTNQAVLQPVPRGDDAALSSMTPAELEAYLSKGKANHEEVLEAGQEAAVDMQNLVKQIVSTL